MKKLNVTIHRRPHKVITNQRGQQVELFVPDNELDYVMGRIDGIVFDTGFYDTEDFYQDSDYNPILLDTGDIVCAFEL